MQVIVSEFGSFLGKKSERLIVKQNGAIELETPFYKVEQVMVTSNGVAISSDAVRECAVAGIPLTFVSFDGMPYAQIQSPHLQGTVLTRREQISAYGDERGVALAKAFTEGKIGNQINLLKYVAKYRKATDPGAYAEIVSAIERMEEVRRGTSHIVGRCVDEVRTSLMNCEGRSAAIYWEAVARLLPADVEFEGRDKRGAIDLVNCLLNYGYGILYSQVTIAILLAGLDPYAGFLHVDRPGKPSLVLDLIEEFRQPVVDRTVLGMLGKGTSFRIEDGRLDDKARRYVAEKVLTRLDARERYHKAKFKLRTILQRQARAVATFVRGEGMYRPFVAPW